MKIEKLLEALMDGLETKANREKVFVGNMSEKMLKERKALDELEEELEEDVKLRIHQLKLQLERQIKREFNDRVDEVEKAHKEFWNGIYNELNLDPSKSYTVNTGEKKVYRYVDRKSEPFDPFNPLTH
jgi:hypothetical protein